MKKNTKKRALANNSKIASQRKETLAAAYSWIKYAISSGFYIEAITIIESLISDRLESRLSFIMNKNIGFQNPTNLIEKMISEENKQTNVDEELLKLLKNENIKPMSDLSSWVKQRNEVVHELAKLEADNYIPFNEKKAKAKIVADKGVKLLRKLDNRITILRRKN